MKLSLKSHDTDLQYMSKNHMNAIYTDGSKAAREKVNQIAHVRKSRGSLGTKNMTANRERASQVWVERAVIFRVD